MKVLFDTSVLVSALLDSHPNHAKAFPWLARVMRNEIRGFVGAHTLAELYSILTSLPIQKKVTTNEILKLIQNSVVSVFTVVELTKTDYQQVLEFLAQNNVRGGAIYDALIARAAFEAQVDKLLTFNPTHFKRVYPQIEKLVEEPAL